MRKPGLYIITGLVVLALAASFVSASPAQTPTQDNRPYRPCAQQIALTDAQKQELAPLYNQMLETKKQILQKYVEYGAITQEQANARISRMQERMSYCRQNGIICGAPGGPGMGKGRGPGAGGPCWQQQPKK